MRYLYSLSFSNIVNQTRDSRILFILFLSPQYPRLLSYFGQPFVFSMLHDYGGTIGLYGKIEDVVNGSHAARNNFR